LIAQINHDVCLSVASCGTDAVAVERPMNFYQIDPTTDARWAELVERHPNSSIFHTVGWLKALQRTYGYTPMVFTTSAPAGELKNGIVFCHINSWLTGNRLVSLPFSDHCEPLYDSVRDLNFLIEQLQIASVNRKWKYLELRPIQTNFGMAENRTAFQPGSKYFLHRLDLRPHINALFKSLDDDSVQRRIQRARRADLVEKCGRSKDLLKEFYALFVITRRRHRLPPIPYDWFINLIQCQGEALEIRVAYKDNVPVAAILTLKWKDIIYYKYGCSDTRFNKFGAMPWLLWRSIETGKLNGANVFDMGRTQEDNPGLLAFKNHWVRKPEQLVYWKFPDSSAVDSFDRWKLEMAKRIFSYMPGRLLTITGRLIYRHIG
jgi:Acetyltransferase (GNAT) domain